MDPYLHTFIAIALMFSTYMLGRHHGWRNGILEMSSMIFEAFDAEELEYDPETNELFVTNTNGTERKIN